MKKTTNFETTKPEDVVNKTFLDKNLSKLEGNISYNQKEYNEYKILSSKESVEEVVIRKVVKATIQILYDKVLFDNFQMLMRL